MTLAERLKPFENKYYISLEQDLTSRKGFRHASNNGEPTTAPDWNPDPSIDCGFGLHVVKGHPLFSHKFVTRKTPPRYFEVTTDPNPPVESSGGGKSRAQTITRIREITDSEPEFSQDLLADLAENDTSWNVRMAAINRLDAVTHSGLLAYLAKNSSYWEVRIAAINRLDAVTHSNFLAHLAENDIYWEVRMAAINRLDAAVHSGLLADLAKNNTSWHVRIAAVNKLDAVTHSNLLADWAKNDSDLDVRRAARRKLNL